MQREIAQALSVRWREALLEPAEAVGEPPPSDEHGTDPRQVPQKLLSANSGEDVARAGDRALWMEARVDATGPLTDPDRVMALVDALPSCPVMSPHHATEHIDFVAVVSLARTLWMHHHVGYCGDTPRDACPPVDETDARQVLKFRVYPSFNIRKFDHQIQTHCAQLKQELLGRLHGR